MPHTVFIQTCQLHTYTSCLRTNCALNKSCTMHRCRGPGTDCRSHHSQVTYYLQLHSGLSTAGPYLDRDTCSTTPAQTPNPKSPNLNRTTQNKPADRPVGCPAAVPRFVGSCHRSQRAVETPQATEQGLMRTTAAAQQPRCRYNV